MPLQPRTSPSSVLVNLAHEVSRSGLQRLALSRHPESILDGERHREGDRKDDAEEVERQGHVGVDRCGVVALEGDDAYW